LWLWLPMVLILGCLAVCVADSVLGGSNE